MIGTPIHRENTIMTEQIQAALGKLDTGNDEHWTEGGKPAMKAVESFYDGEITRAQVDEVAPAFTRTSPTFGADEEKPPTSGEQDGSGKEQEPPTSGAQTSSGPVEALPTSGAIGSNDASNAASDGERAAVEAELHEAQKDLTAANARHSRAYRAMTALLEREARVSAPLADSVKAYQASQQAQRQAQADRKAQLDQFLKGAA